MLCLVNSYGERYIANFITQRNEKTHFWVLIVSSENSESFPKDQKSIKNEI